MIATQTASVVSDPAEALRLSEEALAEAHARWPAVKAVAESLRMVREENHFSERIAKTFREAR